MFRLLRRLESVGKSSLDDACRRVLRQAVVQPMFDAFDVNFAVEESSGEWNSKNVQKKL